jgi:RES domain
VVILDDTGIVTGLGCDSANSRANTFSKPSPYPNSTRTKKNFEDTCKYWWDLYSELAIQRASISDDLYQSISRNCLEIFEFEKWQRTVKYAYSHSPLSAGGSVRYGGGRFNIGDIDPNRYPMFHAIYLAEDKETALQEALGQASISPLHALQVALTNSQSISIVSISGKVESVFDLMDRGSLRDFTRLISNFTLSAQVRKEAKRLNQPDPQTVRDNGMLLDSFLDPNWRAFPQQADVPSNSQIFGQIAQSAQCCGIRYSSKFTGKTRMVVFPWNFQGTSSYLQLDDTPPSPTTIARLDGTNWKLAEDAAANS